jgi:hypothetical protein
MSRHIDLWSLPIKDQAYFILVGREGSWIYNAMYDEMDNNEGFCGRIVQAYKDENPTPCEMVQGYLNESYDSIMAYRARRQAVSDRVDAGDLCLPTKIVEIVIKKR